MSKPTYAKVGHLQWAPIDSDGDVWRCSRCACLTDDRETHTEAHDVERAAIGLAIKLVLDELITPGAFKAQAAARPSQVAAWRESAGVTVVDVNPDVEP